MKTILKAITALVVLSFASISFAAGTQFTDSSSTVIGGGTFKVSKGVKLTCNADTSAYSVTSFHTSGDKQFGSNSSDPKIFTKAKTVGQDGEAPSGTSTDFANNGWSAQ